MRFILVDTVSIVLMLHLSVENGASAMWEWLQSESFEKKFCDRFLSTDIFSASARLRTHTHKLLSEHEISHAQCSFSLFLSFICFSFSVRMPAKWNDDREIWLNRICMRGAKQRNSQSINPIGFDLIGFTLSRIVIVDSFESENGHESGALNLRHIHMN